MSDRDDGQYTYIHECFVYFMYNKRAREHALRTRNFYNNNIEKP